MLNFPVLPLTVTAVAGLADGAISATDANAGRVKWDRQFATYFQGGLLAAGLVGGLAGAHPDWYEPPLFASATLMARRLGFMAMERSKQPPVPAYGGGRVSVAPYTAAYDAAFRTQQIPNPLG